MHKQFQFSFEDNEIKEATKENSLYNWCIENNKQILLDEWDYEKNGDVKPENISKATNYKYAWICSKCGYKWTSSPAHRINGKGCIKCAQANASERYSTVKDVNDSVLIKYPQIVKEWDYEKNERGPETYYPNSNKIVWWICSKCNNGWHASINHRCGRNSGCPVCANLKIVDGVNDLFTLRPNLEKEWDFEKNEIDPHTIGAGFGKKVWWKCERGHSWQAVVYSRTTLNTRVGCPMCSLERRTSLPEKVVFYYVKKYFKDSEENYHPNFLKKKELDIYIPSLNVGIEYDGYGWHKDVSKDIVKDNLCKENNVTLIRIREQGLNDYVSPSIKIATSKYKNDCLYLIDTIIELLKYLGVKNPDVDLKEKYNEILNEYLSIEKENSIANHIMINEWNYEKNKKVNPEYITVNSNRKFWWKCNACGYEWRVSPTHRARGHKCPACAGQVVIKGKNDLLSQNPKLVVEWNYEKNTIKPDEITARNNKKVWWKCSKCGHEWPATIYSRHSGCGCPECKKETISNLQSNAPKDNNLSNFPELLKEWDFEKNERQPETYYPKSNLKVWWKCNKGHSWEAVICSRTMNKVGCPYCSGRYVITGENDLATLKPELLKEWDYNKNSIKPTEVKLGSSKDAWWKCSKCGHEWQTKITVRGVMGCGCPRCNRKKHK